MGGTWSSQAISHSTPSKGLEGTERYRALATPKDAIHVRDMTLLVRFADGAQWPTGNTLQPVLVSLTMAHDLCQVAESDDLARSLDYSAVLSALAALPTSSSPVTLEALADRVSETCFHCYPELDELSVKISRPKALLHARRAGIESERRRGRTDPVRERFSIEGLECKAIVGINPFEREEKQVVRLSMSLERTVRGLPFDFRSVAGKVLEEVQASHYATLEALATLVAKTTLELSGEPSDRVTVRAAKPSALALAEAAEVEICRTTSDFQTDPKSILEAQESDAPPVSPPTSLFPLLAALPDFSTVSVFPHKAAIALGANLGDRFANIELALRLLEMPGRDSTARQRCAVVDTSFLYETAPMYVEDQPKFINGACMIETDLSPRVLLDFLKDIESTVGRVASFRNGPRAIDLDILTYDAEVLDTRPPSQRVTLDNLIGELVIPHPRIAEREFVLRPLADIAPDYVYPAHGKSVHRLLTELIARQPADAPAMSKVVPFPQYPLPDTVGTGNTSGLPVVPPTATYWTFSASQPTGPQATRRHTYIMGTLNATPDSFSDGSKHNTIPAAVEYATTSVSGGADILDVGGYSTRPGAAFVSTEEEIARVVPVVEAIRKLTPSDGADDKVVIVAASTPISVDTFRWEVAHAAVLAGANCINDVYAFTGPAYPLNTDAASHFVQFRKIARELAVPVILMHSRGDAGKNKDYSAYAYAADARGRGAVLEGVRVELGERVDATIKGRGGLRRWNVILDAGIGFSKTLEGNLEVLRGAGKLTMPHAHRRNALAGFPQLVGASRKSFLGALLAQPDRRGAYAGRETRADERGWATAAAVACAVQQGAAVVRVHDVGEMADVVRVAQALWGED